MDLAFACRFQQRSTVPKQKGEINITGPTQTYSGEEKINKKKPSQLVDMGKEKRTKDQGTQSLSPPIYE